MLAHVLSGIVRPGGRRTFPPLRAEQLPAMLGRVEVIRDANGVAHIYAQEERDLYAALGYVQGADRFVLLDIVRHLGAGE
jgi:penicillin amidase